MGILDIVEAIAKGLIKEDDAVKKIAEIGYPESVAKRIASGELPMDEASRMARAKAQDFNVDMPLYHWSDTHGITEFNPSQRGKMGRGIYTTPYYDYGKKYTDSDNPAVYELVQRGTTLERKNNPYFDEARQEIADARALDPNNYQFKSKSEELDFMKRYADARTQEAGYTGQKAYDGRDLPVEQTAFESKDLRDLKNAAFDPEYKGSSILGALAKLGVGVGSGALGMMSPEEKLFAAPAQRQPEMRAIGGNDTPAQARTREAAQTLGEILMSGNAPDLMSAKGAGETMMKIANNQPIGIMDALEVSGQVDPMQVPVLLKALYDYQRNK